ncbi:hypothetical protein B0F90DRAFT_1693299 [Multifurca ochricompacta]|uniref:Zn(2)-C6 fungal-type domain-containing protein n=1 Tax=Multifurca ochricompacta TaxID=376703 RepID=A0AAD4MAI2_9AGAM|nr:hypothetical protein B0F90DRAFT_1693299 [Multifurca ochricompacta]
MPLKSASVPRSPGTASPPYPSNTTRRTSSQPKSSRQQFSACGACRMRRVRCDLKDLPFSNTGTQPQCSNCKERGLKCVDEFAEVKAVKLLRRGRRLQQVEAVYGKSIDEEGGLFAAPSLSPGLIPKLKPEFFSSAFFRRFHIQHPIIDPSEFCARFFEFSKGNCNSLGVPGQLIAMLLAVWAASFGVNEYGIEELHHGETVTRNRREATNEMVREMLHLIDIHGILRKPTWDGVRALHLLLPLTQEIQSPMERLVMYEAMVSQVFTLCSLASISSVGSGQGQAVDILVRARLFWYSHIVEGVTSGLRGGRLLISDDDLASFQKTLPALNNDAMMRTSTVAYEFTYRYAMVPLELASACRKVHAALTGPKARQHNEIDEKSLHEVWDALEKSWKDFDNLRLLGTSGNVHEEDVDRYIHGWQIFIFECLNVIREALKQRTVVHPNCDRGPRSAPLDAATRLLKIADARCHEVVRRVIVIIRQHLGSSFFEYDASLVRDGCFFAGFLLAGEGGSDEDVQICLQALRQMRWAFSKSEEREKTVRMVWESRKGSSARPCNSPSALSTPVFELQATGAQFLRTHSQRPLPPPLSIPPLTSTHGLPVLDHSAPTTACTEDSSWASPLSASSSGPHSPIDGPIGSGSRSTGGSPSSTLVSSNGSPPFFALAQGPTPFAQISTGIKVDSHCHSPPLMFYPCPDTGHYTFTPPPSGGSLSSLTGTHLTGSSVSQIRSVSSSMLSSSPSSHNSLQEDVDTSYNHPSPSSFFDTSSVVYPIGGTSPSALHTGSTLDHTFTLSSSFF